MPFTLRTVVVDCHDAEIMADFYGTLLGWPVAAREPGWVLMRDPGGGAGLAFQAEEGYVPPVWPETAGGQQKMLHLDLRVPDLAAAVAEAVAAGARLAPEQPQDDVRVLLDPAGHPFCVFVG
ncbi:VOC family protein [Streptomyces oryzae]|uniref:VOC family protein n=1 Tax=Streptomyces oryzae TaxID=1434886 RepID=A0ABS3XBI9_9ACTN|nr:VOC family protein [Streptomyces oryzae]MBO8192427.1 VOC family protein [Streptomyces oryzae]